jgi:UDP-N-acetylglucosamine transferase subunit ALG13
VSTVPGLPDLRDDHPVVLTVVGTDHHPFDRLVRWLDAWAQAHAGVQCVVQYGTSAAPDVCIGADYLPHPVLQELVARAAVVVSHGGPGTIMDARRAGLVPVVVPRDPVLGEHVDTHQQRFARLVGSRGLVQLAETAPALEAALEAGLAGPRPEVAPLDASTSREAALRLAVLVDDAVRSRRPRRWRRSG